MRPTWLLMLLSLACNPLERDRGQLTSLEGEERRLQAEVRSLGLTTNALEKTAADEQSRLTRVTQALAATQIEVASTWHGDAKALAALLAQAPQAAPFHVVLEQAQAAGSRQVREARFAEALEKGDLSALAPLVAEVVQWPAAPSATAQQTTVCQRARAVPCKPIDLDAVWCPDGTRHVVWVLVDRGDRLEVASMAGEDSALVARLAPGLWLTKTGEGDSELLVLAALHGPTFTPLWHGPGRRDHVPVERARLNLDDDDGTEALFWTEGSLELIDPIGWNVAEVRKSLAACDALEGNLRVPPPVRAWCSAHRAAADAGL